MRTGIKHVPFTMSQGHNPRIIVSPVEVSQPKTMQSRNDIYLRSMAMWDTGADFCHISSGLVSSLRLKSAGRASVNQTEDADIVRNTYYVDLALPNGIFFTNLLAIEDPGLESMGLDFIIGMSLINEIDFALTRNKKGETVLSISFPGDRLVDFEKM